MSNRTPYGRVHSSYLLYILHEKTFLQRVIYQTGKTLQYIWGTMLEICNTIKEAEKLVLTFAGICIFQTK